MASARKRPRTETEESRAECPFSVILDPEAKKSTKKRKRAGSEGAGAKKTYHQPSPFAPLGKFKTHETLDVSYQVDPAAEWQDMTRYNSFVLNGSKYFSEGFIFVANESTIERQRDSGGKKRARKGSDEQWVARILEIRARDEHHVYARVYWMYWPDELPSGTTDGKRFVQGRQPYHGNHELIASNHMDIINVVSVTSMATVNHWVEGNEDDIQNALYWRQAFDFRNLELSSVDPMCACGQPENPDKTLVGCSNKDCEEWQHDHCILHESLMKTWQRLGKSKPRFIETDEVTAAKGGDDAENIDAAAAVAKKTPLSPSETGLNGTQPSTAVKSEEAPVQDNVQVKGSSDDDDDYDASSAPRTRTTTESDDEEDALATPKPRSSTRSRPTTAAPATAAEEDDDDTKSVDPLAIAEAPGTGRKRRALAKGVQQQQNDTTRTAKSTPNGYSARERAAKPYLGSFQASLNMDAIPPEVDIEDLRQGVEGGVKRWTEPIFCLLCKNQIV